jgi:hypothetical protein
MPLRKRWDELGRLQLLQPQRSSPCCEIAGSMSVAQRLAASWGLDQKSLGFCQR